MDKQKKQQELISEHVQLTSQIQAFEDQLEQMKTKRMQIAGKVELLQEQLQEEQGQPEAVSGEIISPDDVS